jgi:acyl-coenzyme A thioesterase PaaI-like protein
MATPFELFKKTFMLRLLGWTRIPLLASVRPTLVELDDDHCVVRIPLRRWTRNHLGSMYFGALSIGADCAGGLLAVERIRRRRAGLSLVFKAFRADFLKRAEGDVYFTCEDGARIGALVERVLATGERQTEPVRVRGAVRAPDGTLETVAEFILDLSLKKTGSSVL